MPYYAGGMLASKSAYYARNSAGKIYPSLPTAPCQTFPTSPKPSRASALHFVYKMAADKEALTRKPWTAIVLTCQSKASAHTFQKGRQFTYAYVSAFNGVKRSVESPNSCYLT